MWRSGDNTNFNHETDPDVIEEWDLIDWSVRPHEEIMCVANAPGEVGIRTWKITSRYPQIFNSMPDENEKDDKIRGCIQFLKKKKIEFTYPEWIF